MAAIILLILSCISIIECYDEESIEIGPLDNDDISPFYDTIIFNDIIDILNDMEPKGYLPSDTVIKSESESEENIDDLLSEYQRFMEHKAHRQIVNNVRKGKSKNKLSGSYGRAGSFINAKPSASLGRDRSYPNFYEYFPLTGRVAQNSYLDIMMAQSLPKYIKYPEETEVNRKSDLLFDELFKAPTLQKNSETTVLLDKLTNQSTCACKGQQSCECECSFCKIPIVRNGLPPKKSVATEDKKASQITIQLLGNIPDTSDRNQKHDDHRISIKINVDIQMPGLQGKTSNKESINITSVRPKAVTSTKNVDHLPNLPSLPFPLFPIPLEIRGLNKNLKSPRYRNIPNRFHNKKKRANNNNKKHKRKFVTFHKIFNLDAQPPIQPLFQDASKVSDIRILAGTTEKVITNTASVEEIHANVTEPNVEPNNFTCASNTSESNEPLTYTSENITDDIKSENNIDVAEVQGKSQDESKVPARQRRAVKDLSDSPKTDHNMNIERNNNNNKIKVRPDKMDKAVLTDTELLYWPFSPVSSSKFQISANNITFTNIIKAWKKARMFEEKSDSMFSNVNWNDYNVVVKTYLLIAGKYARGVLTFCSDSLCHSLKCAEEVCIYRTCPPTERWNLKGHCTVGLKRNDNVAQLGSMKDVRINILFDMVDTMQERLLGNMIGKATFCTSGNCKTFLSMKKIIGRAKCDFRDLTTMGHCPNIKIIKPPVAIKAIDH